MADSSSSPTQPDLASLGSRFIAFFIDVLILLIPGGLLHVTVPFAGPVVMGFFYYPILHASPMQATLGKKVMGIMVTDSAGGQLTLSMAVLRYFVEAASSCLCFIGHFLALFTERRQAVHDLVADSLVVRGENVDARFIDSWLDSFKRLFGAGQKAFRTIQSEASDRAGRPTGRGRYDELDRLFELRQKGAITEAEYDRLKAEILK
jgi:uncharacterized RDD family membrane protein YckC